MTKLDYKHQSAFFNKNYTRLTYYELDGDKEIMLGEKTPQRCRFCGEDRPVFPAEFRIQHEAGAAEKGPGGSPGKGRRQRGGRLLAYGYGI